MEIISNNSNPNSNSLIRNTEIGRADKFIDQIKDTHCYVSETGAWHIFNGTSWHPEDKKLVQQRAMDFIKSEGIRIGNIDDDITREEAGEDFRRHANKAAVSNLTELASVQLIKELSQFDTDKFALAVKNGWLNLRTGRFNNPEPAKLFSMTTTTEFTEGEPANLWRKTVDEVFKGEQDLALYFQMAVGYSLLGGNSEQVLFICYGSGANGKSLLLDTIRNVLGTYAQAMPINTLMRGKQNAGSASPELARLRGIRFALAAETEKGHAWSANRIKTLTGNDMLTARGLYKDIIEFKSDATIWVACNHKPEVDSSDEAMWRRLRLIPFNRVFSREEQDPDLSSKLVDEYPGILQWILQGLAMYCAQNSLPEPEAVKKATSNYRNEMDSVKRFLATFAVIEANSTETISDVKDTYKYWCQDEGLRPLAASQFNEALESAGCEQIKSGSTRKWRGLRLKEQDDILARRFGMV